MEDDLKVERQYCQSLRINVSILVLMEDDLKEAERFLMKAIEKLFQSLF